MLEIVLEKIYIYLVNNSATFDTSSTIRDCRSLAKHMTMRATKTGSRQYATNNDYNNTGNCFHCYM